MVDMDHVDTGLDRLEGLVRVAGVTPTWYLFALFEALEDVIEVAHIAPIHRPLRGFLKEPAKRDLAVYLMYLCRDLLTWTFTAFVYCVICAVI
jgi:hypothetical protein